MRMRKLTPALQVAVLNRAANHGAVKLCHRKVKLQYSEVMPSDVVLKRGNDQVEVESSVVTTEILRRTFRVSVRVTVCVYRASSPKGLGTRLRVCMIKSVVLSL